MARHDHLRHRRHAYQVTAHDPEHPVFGRRFKRGPLQANVNALLQVNLIPDGDQLGLLPQFDAVNLAHIRKPRSQFIQVLPTQRVLGKKVDMVCDHHQIADTIIGVQSPRRVRHEQVIHPKLLHHPHRERDLLHRVAFIIMKTPLQCQHLLPSQFADYQVIGMTIHC